MNPLKANLTEFIPALAKLADERDFPWDRIDKLFLKKLDKRKALSQGETIVVQACIYDLIISLKKGEEQALGLLHFLGRLFEELDAALSPDEKWLVNGNVKNLLLSFDSNYLNYLGELAVLNNLLKSTIYRLVDVEYPLSNGKSIDFTLEHKETAQRVLVEVMNIQLDSERVEADADMIHNFLTTRLADKVAVKTDGLAEDITFYLIPVIWGGWQQVHIYSDFFKSHKLNLPNVIEPVSYLTYRGDAGYYESRFGSISTLFKQ